MTAIGASASVPTARALSQADGDAGRSAKEIERADELRTLANGHPPVRLGVRDGERESVRHVVIARMLERVPDHEQPAERLDAERPTLEFDDLAVECVREGGRDGMLLLLRAGGVEGAAEGEIEPVAG